MRLLTFISALLVATPVFAIPGTPVLRPEPRSAASVDGQLPDNQSLSELAGGALPRAETNSERLGRGLSPLRPKNLNQDDAAPKPKRSTPPRITRQAVIKVTRVEDGEVIGYIGKNADFNIYGYVPRASAMTVSYTYSLGYPFFDGEITCVDNTMGYPFFGLAGLWSKPEEDTNGFFVSTNQTPPGSPPQAVGNSFSPGAINSESVVWSLDIATGSIIPQWVNPDGSKYPTYIIHNEEDTGHKLWFTGTLTEHFEAEKLHEVKFNLVNLS